MQVFKTLCNVQALHKALKKNGSQIRDIKRGLPKVHNLCWELAQPGIALHFHSLATARPDKPLEGFYQDERLHRTAER